jgi:RNA polymerase sigma factor (TIGR02999 family)
MPPTGGELTRRTVSPDMLAPTRCAVHANRLNCPDCHPDSNVSELTRILQTVTDDDPQSAAELLPLVYEELRRLAAAKLANEAPGQTLQPTALVHEAWLRLGGDQDQHWENRAHFFSAAAEAMRRILIEKARRRQRARHGGGQERVDLDELAIAAPESDERLLQVHEALDQLAAEDKVKAEVVKLRFFVGLTDREVADVLGLAERTVERHWAYAKPWLFRVIRSQS